MNASAATSVPHSGRHSILAALLIVWFTAGTNFLGFKVAVESIPPMIMVGVRLLLAGMLLLPFALRLGNGVWPTRAQWRGVVAAGLLLLVFGQGVIVWGIQFLPAGTTAMFASSAPLWVALFGRAFSASGSARNRCSAS